jgi:hypothetical protein
MRVVKLLAVLFFASTLTALLVLTPDVTGQSGPTEAPAGFDNQTNGFEPQGDPNNPNPQPNTFVDDKRTFEKRDTPETGLGPVYNAQSCAECHQNPVTGGITQIFELRAGRSSNVSGGGIVISPSRSPTRDAFAAPSMDAVAAPNTFVPAPGGSIIQARAVDASIQERVADGPRIIFSGTQQLVSVMGFDGGQYGAVGNSPVDGLYPSFSPDGAQVVFQRNSNIFVMNNDGTNLHQITNTGLDASPAWSPNGTKIAFASRRTGRWQIFLMNEDGTSQVNISNSSADDRLPAWSFNGASIAFTRVALPLPSVEKIWTMTSTGGSQTQVTTGVGNDERPTYAPDNSSIAFSTDRDGNWEIYKIPASGGTATRLTNNTAADTNPAWSPDNSAVAFASDRGGTTRIWATSPDGSIQTQISAGLGDQPSYSRDTGDSVRTFRSSLNVLGDGFVEATDDSTFLAISNAQPSTMRGKVISVPLLEAPGQTRVGRFGWKNSIASLLSFSAAAYLGEVGVTSPLQPAESTSLGRNVTPFDLVADPEDTGGDEGFGEDVEAFTRFMRSTKAPPRDRMLVPVDATDPGSALFDSLSCSVCHVRSISTAPVGTVSNGGTFVVPAALGDKVFHPFGDFLLHDIGTGDGIVETNGETTRNMVRTPPLWGVRTRDRLMHDGGSSSPPSNSGAQSFTFNEAILRHANQASSSRTAYQALTPLQKTQLIRFLKSL